METLDQLIDKMKYKSVDKIYVENVLTHLANGCKWFIAIKTHLGFQDLLTEELVDYDYYSEMLSVNNVHISDKFISIPILFEKNIESFITILEPTNKYDLDIIDKYVSIIKLYVENAVLKNRLSSKSDFGMTRDNFIANMSHEIRTPLNGIVGYNQLLTRTKLDVSQMTYLKSMNKCCLHLMHIINDILDYAKLNAGKMKVSDGCWHLKEIMNTINDAISGRIKEKGQTYTCTIEKGVPEFVVIDKQKYIQILFNIISNANKFSYDGGKITVKVDSDRDYLIVDIIDTGIGISKPNQKKLFDSFIQLDSSVTKKYEGTGLGLSISKKLVELLKGEISVSSELGSGSVFTVKVKYKSSQEIEKKIEEADHVQLLNKTALIVDDNMDSRLFMCDILMMWGMRPILCASAVEAMRYIDSSYKFSIAFLDICMPSIGGNDLARQIRDKNPGIPLIAISSVDEIYIESDFNEKLIKPINKVQLYQVITKSLHITEDSLITEKKRVVDVDVKNILRSERKILITEDVDYNQKILYIMLEKMGYKDIDVAENGKIAMDKIHEKDYDVLLLDIKMPVMDGYSVLNEIKDKKILLPVICVTANAMQEQVDKCYELGSYDVLTKPINYNNLNLKLSELFL